MEGDCGGVREWGRKRFIEEPVVAFQRNSNEGRMGVRRGGYQILTEKYEVVMEKLEVRGGG